MANQDIALFKEQVKAELNRLEAQSPAKDVAGKYFRVWSSGAAPKQH